MYLLPVLGCAAMMGVMMWMMRGQGKPAQPDQAAEAGTREEIAALRAELAALGQEAGPADEPSREPYPR